MDMNNAIKEFNNYTDDYDKKYMEISLKYNHSFEVMKLMNELASRLDLSDEEIELAKLIGLLHDIGRFEQFRKDGVLADTKSDHADESCKYLFTENHIRDFITDDKYDLVIEKAIRYHNKFETPSNYSKQENLFIKLIKDADKIDIYKQVAVNFDWEFKAEDATNAVLENFKNKKLLDRKFLKTKTDRTIFYLSFLYDINFEESFDILDETDNLHLFISVVNVDNGSEKLWKKITDICYEKLREGI